MENNIKKLEIITDYVVIKKFIGKFDEVGISGYSIIKDVQGKGTSGNKDGHGLMAGFKNCYIILFCTAEEAAKVIEITKPLIKSYGGICFVSDGHIIVHS